MQGCKHANDSFAAHACRALEQRLCSVSQRYNITWRWTNAAVVHPVLTAADQS